MTNQAGKGSIGDQIIDYIVTAKLFTVIDDGDIVVWSANAADQLTELVADMKGTK